MDSPIVQRTCPQILVGPSSGGKFQRRRGAERRADLGTLGKDAGAQDLTKDSGLKQTGALRSPYCVPGSVTPCVPRLFRLPYRFPVPTWPLRWRFCTDGDEGFGFGFSWCWITPPRPGNESKGLLEEMALLPSLLLTPMTCVNELGLSLECSIELWPTP